MKCELADCTNETTGKKIHVANWGKGKEWDIEVCDKHYDEAHPTRHIIQCSQCDKLKEKIRKRNLIIKQLRELNKLYRSTMYSQEKELNKLRGNA